jgi:hypothetical protein
MIGGVVPERFYQRKKQTGAVDVDQTGPTALAAHCAMAKLIIFRCPQTGMDVQTLLHKQEQDETGVYEAVICSACTRLHFVDKSTGKALGRDK